MNMKLTPSMRKPLYIMLIALGVLFGVIFGWKGVQKLIRNYYFSTMGAPTVTVSTTTVNYAEWQPHLKAVASLRATLGVNVTAQLAGMIQNIYFTPGAIVEANTVLVQQNADPNIAQLQALEASAELARLTFERDKLQYKVKAISKQQLDTDEQNLKSTRAQVDQQKAIVEQLTIRAPFKGRLGISRVNPGQYLNPGNPVVTLQRLDPIYADFLLPQQALAQLSVGQEVTATVDVFPNKKFSGKITTIDPLVDKDTRNVEVESTLQNPENELAPGMFANVEIKVSKPESFLTVPQTAISFNPYGDIVYVVKEIKKDDKKELVVNQTFVTTGETRGDQITVLTGLKKGDVIVTSGQLKLKNGSRVVINNKVQPANNPNPTLPNEHDL